MIRGVDLKKEHATGDYSVSKWTWDATKWAVYSPDGVCVAIWESKANALADADRLRKEKADGRSEL